MLIVHTHLKVDYATNLKGTRVTCNSQYLL